MCATIFEDVSEGDCMNEFVNDRNVEESQVRPVFDGHKVYEIQRKSRKKFLSQ